MDEGEYRSRCTVPSFARTQYWDSPRRFAFFGPKSNRDRSFGPLGSSYRYASVCQLSRASERRLGRDRGLWSGESQGESYCQDTWARQELGAWLCRRGRACLSPICRKVRKKTENVSRPNSAGRYSITKQAASSGSTAAWSDDVLTPTHLTESLSAFRA
jgi:hypothetical protein